MIIRTILYAFLLLFSVTCFADVTVSIDDFSNDLKEESSEEIKQWSEQRDKEDEEARRWHEKNKDSSFYCHGSGLTEGMRNVCLAIVKREASYCHGSGLTEGMRNMCLAISNAR